MSAQRLVPRDLLRTAHLLTEVEDPSSTDLRRAVSTAYYALFHALALTVAAELIGDPDDARVAAVRRWITHTDLHTVASAVLVKAGQQRTLGKGGRPLLQALPDAIDPRLVLVADTFANLQHLRHQADYDDRYETDRAAVLGYVRNAGDAVAVLEQLCAEREPGTVRAVRLALGALHIAKDRSP